MVKHKKGKNQNKFTKDITHLLNQEKETVLPSTTHATRTELLIENLNNDGPFCVEISNIHYEANEKCIELYFQESNPVKVILYKSQKGKGMIEFSNKNDMVNAINKDCTRLMGRIININVMELEEILKQNKINLSDNSEDLTNNKFSSNVDNELNWRSTRRVPDIASNIKSKSYIDDEQNWRSQKKVPETKNNIKSTTNIDNEDNWRSQKIVPETKNNIKSSTNIDNKLNWRSQIMKIIDNKDNWRSQTKVPETKNNINSSSNIDNEQNLKDQKKVPEKMKNIKLSSNIDEENWRKNRKVQLSVKDDPVRASNNREFSVSTNTEKKKKRNGPKIEDIGDGWFLKKRN